MQWKLDFSYLLPFLFVFCEFPTGAVRVNAVVRAVRHVTPNEGSVPPRHELMCISCGEDGKLGGTAEKIRPMCDHVARGIFYS